MVVLLAAMAGYDSLLSLEVYGSETHSAINKTRLRNGFMCVQMPDFFAAMSCPRYTSLLHVRLRVHCTSFIAAATRFYNMSLQRDPSYLPLYLLGVVRSS